MALVSFSAVKSPLEILAKHLKCEGAEITMHDRSKVVKAPDGFEQHFPYYLLEWRKCGVKRRVLIEPKLKLVKKGAWYHHWQRFEVDNDAMRQKVQSCLSR